VRALALFASSDAGRTYANVCERWGLDPGAPLESIDDVLAYNLRVGLMVARSEEVSEPESDDLVERARRAGAEIRKRMGG
jgi:hypothetical protein